MKKLVYTITIERGQKEVFEKMTDKSVYAKWAKAWGEGMTYGGEWKEGAHMSFFDASQGGTKVVFEKFTPHEYIRARHVAMVNPQNVEVPLTDAMMQKWIGSVEEYSFKAVGPNTTTLEITMTVDQVFQEMFDTTWPKALTLFKEVCEQ